MRIGWRNLLRNFHCLRGWFFASWHEFAAEFLGLAFEFAFEPLLPLFMPLHQKGSIVFESYDTWFILSAQVTAKIAQLKVLF